ncbi:MAG: type III secretion system gatekeeper subunit SctW [Reinekea sp.]
MNSEVPGDNGKLHGRNIQTIPDVSSLLEDAKEEASLLFSERQEKRLARRNVSGARRGVSRSEEVQKIRDLVNKVPDIYKSLKLKAFIETLSADFPENSAQLLLRLESFNRDPTLQYVALHLLSFEVESNLEEGAYQQDIIDGAIDELMDKKGPEVRAGLNVSNEASKTEKKLNSSVQELRDTYRDAVLDYGGITETYRSLLKHHGEGAFETVRKFLERGLKADYEAAGSSIDKSQLKAIMDDMYALKVLGTLHIDCQDIMHTMRKLYGQLECKSGQELMSRILELKDQAWSHVNQVLKIPEEMKIRETEYQSYFLKQVFEVFHRIPEKAYPETEQRHQLLDVFNKAMDVLFKREQEA